MTQFETKTTVTLTDEEVREAIARWINEVTPSEKYWEARHVTVTIDYQPRLSPFANAGFESPLTVKVSASQ